MDCIVCNKHIKQLQNRNRNRCNACNTKIRRTRNKLRAIEMLGGKCARCGYDKHPSAMEFHHLSDNKSFAIGMAANKSWEIVADEVLKCELLCSNCHRIEHSDRFSDDFMKHVLNYKSKLKSSS